MNYPKIKAQSDMRHSFAWLTLIWVAYVALVLLAPAAEAVGRYGLTLTQANILRVTILLPYLFIWSTALTGVVWFRRYSKLIGHDAPESDGYKKLTLGLWMLLLVVIIPTIINAFFTYFPNDFNHQSFAIMLRTYIQIVLYGTGFWYLYQASRSFIKSIGALENVNLYRPIVIGGWSILTFLYVWMVFQNPFRSSSKDPLVLPTYGINDWLIVSTIILPYVIIWLLGALTILNFWSYAEKVAGKIYRNAFRSLAYGFSVTIILLIFLQFLSQTSASLNHATLKIILVVIYLILLAIAIGYLLIARGAQKLVVIEEVE